ncbi:MAG: metallophosphoesterase family protein [Candidatus Heimdallarchaeota archaeon]
MLVGVISDLHANIPALYATLDHLEDLGMNSLLCAGDLVGYYTFPDQVIRELSKRPDLSGIVMGNHDLCIAGGIFADQFTSDFMATLTMAFMETQNFDALQAIGWGVKNTDKGLARFLLQDNFFIDQFDGVGIAMLHGCPNTVCREQMSEVNSYLPQNKAQANKLAIMDFLVHNKAQILISGHTHLAYKIEVAPGLVALNSGSVGQPRDGDPRACCATIEIENGEISAIDFHRVEYDILETQKPVRGESELPASLADRLAEGR